MSIGTTLRVDFTHTQYGYNGEAVWQEVEQAIAQIRASIKGEELSSVISIIALCSESWHLRLSEICNGDNYTRCDLFDWAFLEYRDDLAAMLLLDRQTDFGYLITSPYHPREEEALRSTLSTEHCMFMAGLKPE